MAAGYPYRNKYGCAAAGRRQKMRPYRFLALLAVLCALTMLAGERIFVIEEIYVSGNERLSTSEIAARSGLKPGMNILKVDKNYAFFYKKCAAGLMWRIFLMGFALLLKRNVLYYRRK